MVIIMKNDKDVINYVYKNAKMGFDSTLTLLKSLENRDNKIIPVVEDILKSYEEFKNKSAKVIEKYDEKKETYGLASTLSADMGIKMQVIKDNSDSAIADMLIKGLTMGEIEMTKMFGTFDDIENDEIKKIIKDFKDFQSNAIVKLKKFL